MSRIFWDSMLFIYLLEGDAKFSERVEHLLRRSSERGDALFTSYLALGEILAGAAKSKRPGKAAIVRETLDEMGFHYLPFDGGAVGTFSELRANKGLKAPDAIHVACAASAGIDLFLTGDTDLFGMDVKGIQFIADFNNPLL